MAATFSNIIFDYICVGDCERLSVSNSSLSIPIEIG